MLDAGAGDDILAGGPGDDDLQGGTGRDIVDGGGDVYDQHNGNDVVRGGGGDDRIVGGGGMDREYGGRGRDEIQLRDGDRGFGGPGDDDLYNELGYEKAKVALSGGPGDDYLDAESAGAATFDGGAGDDEIRPPAEPDASIRCGTGLDLLDATPGMRVPRDCERFVDPSLTAVATLGNPRVLWVVTQGRFGTCRLDARVATLDGRRLGHGTLLAFRAGHHRQMRLRFTAAGRRTLALRGRHYVRLTFVDHGCPGRAYPGPPVLVAL